MQKELQFGNSTISYLLEFAERKTLGIKVFPDKSVQVLAPDNTTVAQIEKKVRSKAPWILRQQDFFLSFHPLTPARRFVSGETHFYLGKQYKLKLRESKSEEVKLISGKIEVFVKDKEDKKRIEFLLKKWYKQKAEIHFEALFTKLLPISKNFYKGTPVLKYRWMQKRWGSCDKHGGIHLNLELIKAPKSFIEYVIIHEFCHLEYLNHSTKFYNLLEKYSPNWRVTKDKLERFMV
jgi:predicted metal-dependent hydrolase